MLQSEDIEAIEAVIATLRDTPHLTEIELRQGDRSLTLKRPISARRTTSSAPTRVAESATQSRDMVENAPVDAVSRDGLTEAITVTAHLVGIFRAQRPHPVVSGDGTTTIN